MIYDLKQKEGQQNFKEYVNHLYVEAYKKDVNSYRVEVTKKRNVRSIPQNNYQHILFLYFAMEYGETKEYVKEVIYKQWVNPETFKREFINKKTRVVREDWRSTKDLNTKETTDCIQRFRTWAAKEAGVVLPEPSDQSFLDHIKNLSETNYQYT